MNKEKFEGIIITVIGAMCWGVSGCFGEYLFTYKNIDAIWLVTIRLIFAGLILVLLGFIIEKKKMLVIFKNKKDTKSLLYFSFFGMFMCQMPYFLAVEHSNAGTATVLQALSTVLLLIYICVRDKRLPKKIESFVLVLASIGTFLITTNGNLSTMTLSNAALFFGLLAALGAVLYNVLSISLMKKYGVYVTVGFSMLICGLSIMFITKPWQYDVVFDKGTILGLLGVIIIGTVIAFAFFLRGISMIGSFVGALLGNFEPITALVVSIAFLGAAFGIVQFIGIVLILSTVIILSLYYKTD